MKSARTTKRHGRPKATARRPLRFLVLIQLYLSASVVIYLVGPLGLPRVNTTWVILMIAAYQASFAGGYLLALNGKELRSPSRGVRSFDESWRVFRYRWAIVPVSVVSILLTFGTAANIVGAFSPADVWAGVEKSFAEPGQAYANNALIQQREGSLWTQVSTLASPAILAVNVVGLLYWRRLGPLARVVVTSDLVTQALVSVLRGQNFGVFRVAAVVAAVLLAKRLTTTKGVERRKLGKRLVLLGAGALIAFVLMTADRFRTSRPSYAVGIPINYDSPLVAYLPDQLKLGAVLVSSYFSQGYYAFSRLSSLDHESTWGTGTSVFLMTYAENATGAELWERTFQYQLRNGWSETANWHTAYTWIANDVGVVGVIPVMFFLGWLACRIYQRVLQGSLVACILLPLMLLGLAFIPANTVVMSNPLTCVPLLVWGVVFIVHEVSARRRPSAVDLAGAAERRQKGRRSGSVVVGEGRRS